MGCIGYVYRRYHELEGSNRRRHRDPVFVAVQFDGRAQDPLQTDPVRSHNDRHFLACFIQDTQPHRARILIAELEYVRDLDGLANFEGRARVDLRVPGSDLPQIEKLGLEVLAWSDVSKMVIIFVRTADDVPPSPETYICKDWYILDPDRPERARIGAKPLPNLLRM